MPAKFEDASDEAAYRPYIGAIYVSQVPMHLSGVNAPPGYGKTIDYYRLNPATPSWSGPELITRETLPPGTLIEVEAVERCTNCIFDAKDRLEARVRLPQQQMQSAHPITISLNYLAPPFTLRKS